MTRAPDFFVAARAHIKSTSVQHNNLKISEAAAPGVAALLRAMLLLSPD